MSRNASTRPPGAASRMRPAVPSPWWSTGSTSCRRSQSWLYGAARPITVAPFRLASWTAIPPTPPAAADTTTVSPGLTPTARTMAQAVNPATGSAPATSQGRPDGFGARFAASATTYSAWLDRVSTQPITLSPTAVVVTSGPSCSTTPAKSVPCPDGNVAGQSSCRAPSRIFVSPGLMPAALTLTSTCPGPGSGTGTSRTSSTSTVPYSSNRTAFIVASGRRLRLPGRLLGRSGLLAQPWPVVGYALGVARHAHARRTLRSGYAQAFPTKHVVIIDKCPRP